MTATPTDDTVLLVETDDNVAFVTLNRPERRNALNSALRRALHETLNRLDDDPSVRAIVLTGADPAFCAGLDLTELGDAPAGDRAGPGAEPAPPVGRTTTPVIGAVNGAAITGGLELALNCDLLIASEKARFADTHARVGIMPWWGLTYLLPQAIGVRRAVEMSLTGNFVDAQTAYDWGLVNHVVPHEDLVSTAVAMARDMASIDQRASARMLETYREGVHLTTVEPRRIEDVVAAEWLASLSDGAVAANRDAVIARGRTQTDNA